MKLYDVYKKKNGTDVIQIDSFATKMGRFGELEDGMIIVFRHIEKHNEFEIGSYPSFNGYGTKEEIESAYELLVSADDLKNYSDWNEIIELANRDSQ